MGGVRAVTSSGLLRVSEVFGPTIQGEGPAAGRAASFVRLMGCNLSCAWCVEPDSLILRPTFTWTPAGDLRVGDKVLGRTDPKQGRHGQLIESTVTNVAYREAPLVRVNKNLVCAADTRFWASHNRAAHSGWRNIERCVGLNCQFLAEPIKRNEEDYQWGYLAGMADGDGCFWNLRKDGREYRRFRLALNDRTLLRRFRDFAIQRSYTLRDGNHSHTGFTGKGDMPCLWLTDSVNAYFFEQQLAENRDSESWRWGYLAGIFDAEGNITDQGVMRIAQHQAVNSAVYERIVVTAERLGFDVVREKRAIRLRGRGGELWRFLVGATPGKETSLQYGVHRSPNNARVIESAENAGYGNVVSLTTSTGNYVAEGWLVHNCDTRHTWDGSRYDLRTETELLTAAQITARLSFTSIYVLTGGEPLLQQRQPAFAELVLRLAGRGEVHVETNGTLAPDPAVARGSRPGCRPGVTTWVVSPKLPSAGPHRGWQNPALHPAWRGGAHGAHLKVVCLDVADAERALALANAAQWPRERVWLMPEGEDVATLNARWRSLAEFAAEHGVNASYRLHVAAWGAERGR